MISLMLAGKRRTVFIQNTRTDRSRSRFILCESSTLLCWSCCTLRANDSAAQMDDSRTLACDVNELGAAPCVHRQDEDEQKTSFKPIFLFIKLYYTIYMKHSARSVVPKWAEALSACRTLLYISRGVDEYKVGMWMICTIWSYWQSQ